ncbi:MAG: glutamate racemase [Treponema sp.]|jgi:glutamate racemase|nr:glutamate racemase [Treponema sp.]
MNNRQILFIDSGMGGIPYCTAFLKENQKEAVCYLADNKNFPYGPREKEELISILNTLVEKAAKKIEPKIIVLACNTATIAALFSLRRNFPQIPFVGTVPAVKPAAKASKNGKVGVLGTQRTIEEISRLNLANEACEIFGIAAPDLAEFVELRLDDADEKEKIKIIRKYIDLFREANVDTLVLGCTHFLFLLEEFQREAKPFFKIFDSVAGIVKRIEYLLNEKNAALRAEREDRPVHRLLLTGEETSGSLWEKRAKNLSFDFSMLDEL